MIVYCPECEASYFMLVSSDIMIKTVTAECPKCGTLASFKITRETLRGEERVAGIYPIGGTEHKDVS